jgi:pseudaminic acid cytidylyltransferase
MLSLAVIPARGGSKRIPQKNIRPFRGQPMIGWSIQAAQKAQMFDRVIVSTDDAHIASIASSYGVEVPFIRPSHLADDTTATAPVIAHALEMLGIRRGDDAVACCIYPCAPFFVAEDLARAKTMLTDHDAAFVYPVVEYPHPVHRAMRRLPSGQMQFLLPECELARTQDLEVAFHDAGQFYMGRSSAWLDGLRMHTAGLGMPIPAWRVVDIDDDASWRRAELVHEVLFPEACAGNGDCA